MKKAIPEFLLIDIGNTRLKWTIAKNEAKPRAANDIPTKDVKPSWVKAFARKHPASRVILSSVVPKLVPLFQRDFFGRIQIVSGNSPALGLQFDYPKPGEIGADRLAAAVAVNADGLYPAIIISCGTATAFTVLDAKGRLCGGAIAPGLQTQLVALLGATAQLPETILRMPRSALAKSTQDAIRAGVLLNFQGGVKEIIHQLSAALAGNKKPHIILTGGNAHHLLKSIGLPHTLRPLLVFEGLRIIGNRVWNASPS